jgi:hypothetical protein
MNTISIYNPFTDKIVKINKFGRTAKRIYKFYIDVLGNTPDEILPNGITYVNNRFRKINTIIDNSNVRRITYAEASASPLGPEEYIYRIIKKYKGQTVKLARKYILDGNEIEDDSLFVLDSKGISMAYRFLAINSEIMLFSPQISEGLPQNQQAQLLILSLNKVNASNVSQYFLDGITHCVFTPIKDWAEDKLNNSSNKSTASRYKTILNKVNKYTDIYSNGVPEKDLTDIANDLQISIEIDLPSTLKADTRFLTFESQKKPLRKFRFLNTRLNHIEINKINNLSNFIEVSQEQLKKKYHDNYLEFVMYKKNRQNKLTQVITNEGVFVCNNSDYKEATEELNELLKGCRIEYNSNKELSNYIYDNINNPHMKNFMDIEYNFDEEVKPVFNLNHIDIKKAYATFDKCDYYKGFLGKITDFRECNKIMGIGIYTITNIECDIEIINELEYLFDGNAYPSPELEYFKSLGIKFDIVGGCWGDCVKFTIPYKMYEKSDGVKHYCRWYGCLQKLDLTNRFTFTCKDIELAQLNAFHNPDVVIRSCGYKEAIIEYPKKYVYHQAHIASFIHGYTRITMIQQLLKFKNISQIKAVNVDGIYYEGDVEVMDRFSEKEHKDLKYIYPQCTYGSPCENQIEFPKFRKDNKIEVHLGCGGSGKTHGNLIDDGFINKLYIAPSWKLAKEKQLEYNINSAVFNRLLTDDPEVWKIYYNNYNVLIIDEISMMTDEEKEKIINRFNRHKIIFCGDVGFQLPPIEGQEFKITNDYPIITHNKNYRCLCPKLLNILNNIRNEISKGSWFYDIKKLGLPIIKLKDLDYIPQDLIISKTNNRKDLITATFKDLEKYVVLANYTNYCNTQILLEKPPAGIRHELRHGYTIYSCQGCTTSNKLFIDIKNLKDIKTIYTALSRAKYLSQIIFFE